MEQMLLGSCQDPTNSSVVIKIFGLGTRKRLLCDFLF